MALIRINRQPDRRQLRVFAAVFLVVFGSGAIAAYTKGHPTLAAVVTVLAGVVALVGIAAPLRLRRVYLGLTYAAFPVGWTVSMVVLAAVYYLVLTPIGLVRRGLGQDPLSRRLEPSAMTYWKPRDRALPPESYLRQY